MDQGSLQLAYGDGLLDVNLEGMNILGVLDHPDGQVAGLVTEQEQYQEVVRALRQPIAHLPLADALRGKGNIVIIVSDHTRPVPTWLLVRAIVAEGTRVGGKIENFCLVVALGAHPTQGENLHSYLPPELKGRVAVYINGQTGFTTLGQTALGTLVEVDSRVAEAEYVIATGNIEMHRLAGFSGGAKAIMPGVCSRQSIQANHSLINRFQPQPGQISENLIRQDIEEAAQMCGVNYLLNVVMDNHKQIRRAVAGELVAAHRQGCELVQKLQKVPVTQMADVVVASAGGLPKDGSLYQGLKAMLNASELVKPGGHLVVLMQCPQGYGDPYFASLLHRVQSISQLKEMLAQNFVLGYHKAQGLVQILEHCHLHIISDNLAPVSWLGVHPSSARQDVLQEIISQFTSGLRPTAWVLPKAGYIFPQISESV